MVINLCKLTDSEWQTLREEFELALCSSGVRTMSTKGRTSDGVRPASEHFELHGQIGPLVCYHFVKANHQQSQRQRPVSRSVSSLKSARCVHYLEKDVIKNISSIWRVTTSSVCTLPGLTLNQYLKPTLV